MIIKPKKFYTILGSLLTVLIVGGILAAIIYYLTLDDAGHPGAIVTNGKSCARIGGSILQRGGSAVDAAIAALFCEGVSMPQSMGLGGGFLMTIYLRQSGQVVAVNARETAPLHASENMFNGNGSLSTKGGLAVAVPGELKGYWEVYQRYGGKVSWKDLIQPTIDLCQNGIPVTAYLAKVFASKRDDLYNEPFMREVFIDPTTNDTYKEGQMVKRARLAKTLELVAEHGADVLYNGLLTDGFVKDIQNHDGIITVQDLNNYKPEFQEPIKINLPANQVLYTSPLPGSGVILGFIMNILSGFLDHSQPLSVTNWQRIVESFKYGYGKRTQLGDTNFVPIQDLIDNLTSTDYARAIRDGIADDRTYQDPEHYGANTTAVEDHGTAHISVLSANGDVVSVTSTINLYFGAGFMSPTTGIILNDEMDDFSSPNMTSDFNIPPSLANYIVPGKRPLSSMCPSIIVDATNGKARLIVGAAGGTKITTTVALIIIKKLWFNYTMQEAVYDRRLHHQLFPMRIEFEEKYTNDMDFVDALHAIGHEYEISETNGFSAATAIAIEDDIKLDLSADKRRPGEIYTT